ncbi:BsaWI family type II restriction enzyme [Archaeoglobus sp.]
MKRGFRCKQEIIERLKKTYNDIAIKEFNGDYLEILKAFESIAEERLRKILDPYYSSPRSRDQAWKNCKGELYEFAVFKYVESVIASENIEYSVLTGNNVQQYKDQFAIRNWSEIFPDVDILIVKKDKVKIIISCKTSLRERLTETAFWKRELERHQSTKDIKVIFVTTDKDNELQQEINRYILLHVLDCTFVTDPEKYQNLIRCYRKKYGSRDDFDKLLSKVRFIADFKDFLVKLD